MSIFDTQTDTTTPAQRVAARILDEIRIAARMLMQTYSTGYTALWHSKMIDAQGNPVDIDPVEIATAFGSNGAQAMSLTAIIGQLFGEDALTPIPAGYAYTLDTTTGVLALTYTAPAPDPAPDPAPTTPTTTGNP